MRTSLIDRTLRVLLPATADLIEAAANTRHACVLLITDCDLVIRACAGQLLVKTTFEPGRHMRDCCAPGSPVLVLARQTLDVGDVVSYQVPLAGCLWDVTLAPVIAMSRVIGLVGSGKLAEAPKPSAPWLGPWLVEKGNVGQNGAALSSALYSEELDIASPDLRPIDYRAHWDEEDVHAGDLVRVCRGIRPTVAHPISQAKVDRLLASGCLTQEVTAGVIPEHADRHGPREQAQAQSRAHPSGGARPRPLRLLPQ